MRLLVDLKSHLTTPIPAPSIVQVQKTPPIGSYEIVNGKYVLPVPLDVEFPIGPSSHVLDPAGTIDGGDVSSIGFAHLLASMPMYSNVWFNPLLTVVHVAELVDDTSASFADRDFTPPALFYPRFQTGRADGGLDDGQMPTHTAILPRNTSTNPDRPGLLLTHDIDIGPHTLDCDAVQVGADEFAVWWKLYRFDVTHDVSATTGAQAGKNEPALRRISEVGQEPVGLSVYISIDEGTHWCPVGLLENVAFCTKSKKFRLAFRNDSDDKLYLAAMAVLF